jgi:oligopeptide transport system substrate-binding protein
MQLKISALLLFLLALLGILPVSSEEHTTDTQDEGMQNDFVMALGTQDISLDPIHVHKSTEIQILTALCEGLMTYHPITLEPIPAIAEHWTLSDDKLVYTFFLRENAYFSNGDPVTANDFKATWLELLNPSQRAEYSVYLDVIKGAEDYRKGITKNPETLGIRVLEDKILEVELEKPTSHFLKLLCILSFSPVHSSYRGKHGWDRKAPLISNGPFFLYQRKPNVLILYKNPH